MDSLSFVEQDSERDIMAITHDTIDHVTLSHLVEAGAVRGADVIGQPGGWGVVIKYGMTERALAARRGAVRTFRKFETLVGYLKEIGIAEYRVNAANFDPLTKPMTSARPDSAERLRHAHESAAYDDWFRAKVAASLEGVANGTNRQIAPDEWAMVRAAKQVRRTV
jgi:hypothetical protein